MMNSSLDTMQWGGWWWCSRWMRGLLLWYINQLIWMDSFAKSIKGDVKITVGTVSAPGSYVQHFIPSLPFPLWQSLSSRPIYLSVLGAQQRNKQVVPPLHNNLIEPKQSLCCGCASIQFPVPSSALSPLAFNLVLLHVHSFSQPIHPPLSSPWDHPISRTGRQAGTRTLCVSLYSFMGYIMHPIKIPVEVDFRCEMATKVSLNMSFSPPTPSSAPLRSNGFQ